MSGGSGGDERRRVAGRRARPQAGGCEPGACGPVVLARVPREAFVNQPEERVAAGSPAGMQGQGLRDEENPPAAIRQAAHQVGLLGIEEKVLVESSRLLERAPADEQDGSLERFDFARAGVVFPGLRMTPKEAPPGNRGQAGGLAEDPPGCGEPLDGSLRAAVRILETRPGDGGAWI